MRKKEGRGKEKELDIRSQEYWYQKAGIPKKYWTDKKILWNLNK